VNFREHRNKRVLLCVAAIAVAGLVLRAHVAHRLPTQRNVAAQH
jgi:hypothetical protein